jgi:DNA topoisomerase-2
VQECCNLPLADFGSRCEFPDELVKKVVDKLKLKQIVAESARNKDQKLLASTSGSKCTSLRIPKLDDAVLAGTKHSHKCTLVLTEGDSAKTFATTGISALVESDRKLFGSFPLRVSSPVFFHNPTESKRQSLEPICSTFLFCYRHF